MAAKPRILNSSKDMIWSLIPLVVLCAFVAIVSQNCSVGLHGDASDDKTPRFEVTQALRADASTLAFPIRQPQLPASWKPNSGTTQPVGGSMSSNVGWVTDRGAYIQLSQTGASEDDLVVYLSKRGDDDDSEMTKLLGSGMKTIDGKNWVTYASGDTTKVWISNLGDVRLAVLSKGSDAEMTTLAKAVQSAPPLSKRG